MFASTCAAFSASYIVRMFQVAIMVVVLDFRRGVGLAVSIRLSLQCVIFRLCGGPSKPTSGSFAFVVDVSLTDLVFFSGEEL